MMIAIIGGGFTGLSCAVSLVDRDAKVTIFEAEEKLGGLAVGFNSGNWKWDLEIFYHHIFTNDSEIISLAEKVGWPEIVKEPKTTSFLDGEEMTLDSPISVLKFSKLSVWGRLRMGIGLAVLKIIPNGLFLEKFRVEITLPKLIGCEGYEVIWEKLLKAKFGPYSDKVNMAWFWSRVAKRTKNLAYFEGGFQKLADKMGEYVEKKGGKIFLNKTIKTIENKNNKWFVDGEMFDKIVVTTPAPIAEKIIKEIKKGPKIDYLSGQTLILEIKKSLIKGYWMNILEKEWPFLVAVEHTNMIDKKNYGEKVIVYLGNYLADGHKQLSMNKEGLLKLYLPYLKKINKEFDKSWVVKSHLFRKPFAQPVFPTNYSKIISTTKTDTKGLYMANMSMVYPFDRGTNYAVKMGELVAEQVINEDDGI